MSQVTKAANALKEINAILQKLSREQRKFVLMSLSALLVKEMMPDDVRKAIEGTVDDLRRPRPINDCDACQARHDAGLGPCELHP
jgi:hypothetical protein